NPPIGARIRPRRQAQGGCRAIHPRNWRQSAEAGARPWPRPWERPSRPPFSRVPAVWRQIREPSPARAPSRFRELLPLPVPSRVRGPWLLQELWLVPVLSSPPAPWRPGAPLPARALWALLWQALGPSALPLWPLVRPSRARSLSPRTLLSQLRPAAVTGLRSGFLSAPASAYPVDSFPGGRCVLGLLSRHCLWPPSHRPLRCPPPWRRAWRRLHGRGEAHPWA